MQSQENQGAQSNNTNQLKYEIYKTLMFNTSIKINLTKSVLANKLKLLTYIPLSINRNNNTIKRICRLGNSCHLTNKVVLTLSVFSSGSQAQKSP